MSEERGRTSLTPRLQRPTGVIVSMLTLPIGFYCLLNTMWFGWSLVREVYCRHFYETSPGLCQFIDYDFRPDLALIAFALLVLYPIAHLSWLRSFALRSHLLLMAGLAAIGLLTILASSILRAIAASPVQTASEPHESPRERSPTL